MIVVMSYTIYGNIHFRVALATALFVSVFLAPWWVTVWVAVAFALIYTPYEVVIAGLLFDILYTPPIAVVGVSLMFFTGALGIFVLQFFVKKFVIFYWVR
jgi:hypothetical protein